jgi:hypothetical protein
MLTLHQPQNIIWLRYVNPLPSVEIKQWNIKLDQIKICALFEYKWKVVNSSMLRMMTVLANCWLRRIFATREREAEVYVTMCVERCLC